MLGGGYFFNMIRIFLGNIGSGKTAMAIREMIHSNPNMKTYSNIITKKQVRNTTISAGMIIKKEVMKIKKTGEAVYKKTLNVEYWKKVQEKEGAINVILDEAHTIINPRRSMSDTNKVMTDFLALLRRILGNSPAGYGQLTLITQLDRRIDVIAVEMATNVRFHLCHYLKTCQKCGNVYRENNDHPDPIFQCPNCSSWDIVKHSHIIEVWEFSNMDKYKAWDEFRYRTYFKHYYVNDIENYFSLYNTLQWDNLISDD